MQSEKKEILEKKLELDSHESKEVDNPYIDLHSLSKKELIEEMLELSKKSDAYLFSKKAEQIKACFYTKLQTENTEKEIKSPHPLEDKFKKSYNRFKKIKSNYRKKVEKEENKNLELKTNIIREIDNLSKEEESIKDTFAKFKILQQKWRETGKVPIFRSHDLWRNYHHHVELFYDYIKINKELRDLDFKKNLEEKMVVCEKAEKLLSEKSLHKMFYSLQELHEHWKNIGPVQKNKRKEIWERFQSSTKKIHKKRNDFFLRKKKENNENLNLKRDVCKKISELTSTLPASHSEWIDLASKMLSLSEKWKKASPVNKPDLKKAWSEFRTVRNDFFKKKNDFYKNKKQNTQNYLKRKILICEQAEKLSISTDWKNTSKQLIKLQKDWKESDFVPNNLSTPIWKRFSNACDIFFTAKRDHDNKKEKEKEKNLELKKSLLKELEKFKTSKDAQKDVKHLKKFSTKWDDIGIVPKKKVKINTSFNKLLSSFYDNLNIKKSEKDDIQFIIKKDSFKANPSKLKKEIIYIKQQIKEINKTIIQYENNISFFGDSNGSSKLKQDVLKSIEESKLKSEKLQRQLSILNKI